MMKTQETLKPYKDKSNDKIEILSVISWIITLHWALVFVSEDPLISVYNFALMVWILSNLWFILNWVYLLAGLLNSENTYYKKFMKLFAIMLLKNKNASILSPKR